MNSSSKVAYDYYKINFFPGDFPDPGERAELAILEAEERTRTWATPCNWEVISDDGQTVTVRRTRLAHRK